MSRCASPMLAANTAVRHPTTAMTPIAVGDASSSGDIRHRTYTPAVTIVAAWISADTGVGPSIASGSQTYSGICADLPVAPTNSKSVISDRRPNASSGANADTDSATDRKSMEPNAVHSSRTPRMNPKSPIRLTMNAFLPASAADFFWNQNPIRRYEHNPTPSHPTNITRKFAPSTSSSMNAANRLRYEK